MQLSQPDLDLSREYLLREPQEPEVKAYAKYQVGSSYYFTQLFFLCYDFCPTSLDYVWAISAFGKNMCEACVQSKARSNM